VRSAVGDRSTASSQQLIFWREGARELLRDFALDREHVFQIAIGTLPQTCVSVRVSINWALYGARLRSAHAALQNMRHPKRIADLVCVVLVTILHHARPADDLEIGNFASFSKIVLHTVGKEGSSVVAQFSTQPQRAFSQHGFDSDRAAAGCANVQSEKCETSRIEQPRLREHTGALHVRDCADTLQPRRQIVCARPRAAQLRASI